MERMEAEGRQAPHVIIALIDREALARIDGALCSICQAPMRLGEEGVLIKCNHIFHLQCISRWFAEVCLSARFVSELQTRCQPSARSRPKTPLLSRSSTLCSTKQGFKISLRVSRDGKSKPSCSRLNAKDQRLGSQTS